MSVGLVAILVMALAGAASAQQPGCDLVRSMSLRESGRDAMAKHLYDSAARSFEQAIQACPDQPAALLELAEAQTFRRDFPQAIAVAQRFLELEPASVPGRLALANAYFMAQRLSEARREVERVLKAEPANAAALKIKGNVEYLTGDLDSALNTFFILLDKHPEDEQGPYMLGRIYYQEGRIEHAAGQFQRVLKINPYSYKAYDNLGLCYEALGDTEKAIRYYLTAIRMVEKDHPEYDWAYANLANLLLENGDAEKAFAAASKAADRNPYSARTFYIGGKALFKLGKTELALNWLQRSASLDSNYPEPLYLLARVYRQLGQADKAQQALDKFQEVRARTPHQRK